MDVHWPKQVTEQAECGSGKCGVVPQIIPEMGQAEKAIFVVPSDTNMRRLAHQLLERTSCIFCPHWVGEQDL